MFRLPRFRVSLPRVFKIGSGQLVCRQGQDGGQVGHTQQGFG